MTDRGIWPRFMAGVKPALIVNGAPGFVVSSGGQVHYALTFEIAADRIQAIYIVCNPDKLRHLATGNVAHSPQQNPGPN